eukprot:6179597-Pleurochrysis_carterae.AAC.1
MSNRTSQWGLQFMRMQFNYIGYATLAEKSGYRIFESGNKVGMLLQKCSRNVPAATAPKAAQQARTSVHVQILSLRVGAGRVKRTFETFRHRVHCARRAPTEDVR